MYLKLLFVYNNTEMRYFFMYALINQSTAANVYVNPEQTVRHSV